MQGKDNQKIQDFIMEHRPHVVLVAGTNLQCRWLHTELVRIRDYILSSFPQFLTRSETGDMDIIYADDHLAALWENSAAARQELGDQPPLVRKAVSAPACRHSQGLALPFAASLAPGGV
jgi:transcription elongation factor SPT6